MRMWPCMLGNATFWYTQTSAKAQQQRMDGLLSDRISSSGKCAALSITDYIYRSCVNYMCNACVKFSLFCLLVCVMRFKSSYSKIKELSALSSYDRIITSSV